MAKSKPFNAHYRCTWCHGLKSKSEIIGKIETPFFCSDRCKLKDKQYDFNVDCLTPVSKRCLQHRMQIRALGTTTF